MKRFLLYLLICLLPLVTFAEDSALYRAEIPVVSTNDAPRRDAIQAGAEQVLVKVSGNQGINTLPFIKDKLTQAGDWVQKYSYRRSSPYAPLLITIEYDKSRIDQLIKEAGQAIWSQVRPSILTWVLQDKTDLLSADADSGSLLLFDESAKARGIQLIFPLGDLADMSVTPEMLNQGDCRAVSAASKRYHRNTVLCATLSQDNGQWQGKWSLVFDDQMTSWDIQGKSRREAIETGINNIADYLASRMAEMSNAADKTQIDITINGVKTINDYAALSTLLRELSSVRSIEVIRVAPEQVSYNVKLAASLSTFVQNLAQSGHLEALNEITDFNNHSLNYRWAS